jgi:hypothetical protein
VVRDVRKSGSNKEPGIYCYFVDRYVRTMICTRILASIGSRPFYLTPPCSILWYAVAQFVEALRYKPEGRGFDFRWCHWNISLTV